MAKLETIATDTKLPYFGKRHVQCLLLFCGLIVAFGMRVNLSVSIVAMTDKNSTSPGASYEWSEKTKSLVLSSFFWGYFITQIPGGYLSHRFGSKLLLLQCILVSSVLTLLIPLGAKIGNWPFVCGLRLMQGLCQGVLFPTCHTVVSKWVPPEERGLLGSFAYSGTQLGIVLMLAVSGVLAASPFGWPSIFYASGGLGLVWVVAWIVWGASSPSDCKSITAAERKLIETSTGQGAREEASKSSMHPPWAKIFTSAPFWVLLTVHCAHNWGFWTLLTQIPTYMKHILGMDIKSNALLSALPYFAMFLLNFFFAGVGHQLQKHEYLSLAASRKLFNSISQWIPMLGMIGLGYMSADHVHLAVILLTFTVGVNAASHLGFHLNHIDLSPNFAGILMGMTNCAANIVSIIAPLVVGVIVTDEKNPDQWRTIFFIAGGVYFFGNLIFVLFGKANVQPWNKPTPTPQELKLISANADA